MSLLFIFVDGVGIGKAVNHNPLFTNRIEFLGELTGNPALTDESTFTENDTFVFKPVDANLDMEGLPQSGTGQTALFTSENGAKIVGRHFGPYPHSKLKPALTTRSFFHKMMEAKKLPYFLNAYPPVFFELSHRRNRWSCSTLMVKNSGQVLNSTKEVKEGKAITAELMGDYWRSKLNIDLPKRSPADVAEIILEQTRTHDVTLLEYYLTDKAGHSQNEVDAAEVLQRLDKVLCALQQKRRNETILICSDHGNIEDLSTKTHTRNPVPLITLGSGAQYFSKAESIMDICDGILNYSHSI